MTYHPREGSLRDGDALRGWLAQIAVGQVRRRFRRRRLFALLGLDRAEEDATFESLAAEGLSAEQAAELGAIDALLAKLPVEQRIAWVLRYVEGESLAAAIERRGAPFQLSEVLPWLYDIADALDTPDTDHRRAVVA